MGATGVCCQNGGVPTGSFVPQPFDDGNCQRSKKQPDAILDLERNTGQQVRAVVPFRTLLCPDTIWPLLQIFPHATIRESNSVSTKLRLCATAQHGFLAPRAGLSFAEISHSLHPSR
jgi:hypothetical protein